jgi:hypothetical protein
MGTLSAAAIQARSLFTSKVKPGADAALKANRDMATVTKEMFYGAEAAIGGGQVATITLFATKVKAQIPKVEASILALDAAIAKLTEFAKANKAVLSELPEVEKLGTELADERKKATTRVPALKAAQDKAEKAGKAAESSRVELNAQWARIDADARNALTEVLAAVKTMTGHRDKARVADKAKDLKALKEARGKAELMANPYLSDWPKAMQKKLAEFTGRYAKQPNLDPNVRSQLAKDQTELKSVLERIGLNAKLIDDIRKEALQIGLAELRKAGLAR